MRSMEVHRNKFYRNDLDCLQREQRVSFCNLSGTLITRLRDRELMIRKG